MKTKWKRNCPNCNDLMYYSNKYNLKRSSVDECLCKSCSKLGKLNPMFNHTFSETHIKKLKEKRKGGRPGLGRVQTQQEKNMRSVILTEYWKTDAGIISRNKIKKNNAKYWLGKERDEETKVKIRNTKFGQTASQETKNKMSKSHIEYRENNNVKQIHNYNKLACKYFDWLNMYMGWNGQHATYNGEKQVGRYFVDYYEPELNLVIEWDEYQHYDVTGKLKEKDINRQEYIEQVLNCKFYRIKQKRNKEVLWEI